MLKKTQNPKPKGIFVVLGNPNMPFLLILYNFIPKIPIVFAWESNHSLRGILVSLLPFSFSFLPHSINIYIMNFYLRIKIKITVSNVKFNYDFILND